MAAQEMRESRRVWGVGAGDRARRAGEPDIRREVKRQSCAEVGEGRRPVRGGGRESGEWKARRRAGSSPIRGAEAPVLMARRSRPKATGSPTARRDRPDPAPPLKEMYGTV